MSVRTTQRMSQHATIEKWLRTAGGRRRTVPGRVAQYDPIGAGYSTRAKNRPCAVQRTCRIGWSSSGSWHSSAVGIYVHTCATPEGTPVPEKIPGKIPRHVSREASAHLGGTSLQASPEPAECAGRLQYALPGLGPRGVQLDRGERHLTAAVAANGGRSTGGMLRRCAHLDGDGGMRGG